MPKPQTLDRKILPDDLPRIIQLYREGNTQVDIGMEYGVDHSTIRYYLFRAGEIVAGQYNWRRSLKKVPPVCVVVEPKKCLAEQIEGPVRKGKSYAECIAAASKRERRAIIHILTGKLDHVCVTITKEGDI